MQGAATEAQRMLPGIKIDLVQQKHRFIVIADGEPVMEITAGSLASLKPHK